MHSALMKAELVGRLADLIFCLCEPSHAPLAEHVL